MNLIIKYGKKFELTRIKNTISKLNWYKENNYFPKLPEKINSQSTEKEIIETIEKKFNEEEYKSQAKKIRTDFEKLKERIEEKTKDLNLAEEIYLFLTKWGMGGSYSLPNKVILNFNNKNNRIKTIVHELLHLGFEKQVLENNLSQIEKENLINEEMKKRFGDLF